MKKYKNLEDWFKFTSNEAALVLVADYNRTKKELKKKQRKLTRTIKAQQQADETIRNIKEDIKYTEDRVEKLEAELSKYNVK